MTISQVQRNTIFGLVASLLLAIIKLVAGVFGHSSALIADSIESLADSFGSILVWQALRISSRPPDAQHPYGYGKAEALAALAVGAILILAAVGIVWKSIHEILIPHQAPQPWTLAILVAVIVVKEILFRVVIQGADRHASDAARADAWHHRSDAITSAAAFIGVAVAIWGPQLSGIQGLVSADEAAAMMASGIIVITAWQLMRPSMRELLDATSSDMEEKIAEAARGMEGVIEIEKVFVRKSGSIYHADMHMHVDPELSIRVAHGMAGKVKSQLMDQFPNLRGILIHIEPGVQTLSSDEDRSNLANVESHSNEE